MKRVIFLILWFIPIIINGQTGLSSGFNWIEGFTWEQIKEKAKKENKFIFVNCYATWCGPCKAMDRQVYGDMKVAKLMNSQFISVKVQMDKTDDDKENVKKWYQDARSIESNYTITAFPSFLFFSPEGKPLHKAVGYKTPEEFVTLIREALKPEKQYYRLLTNFQPGKMDTTEMKGLARSFRISDYDFAGQIAADYLMRIKKSEFLKLDNTLLIEEFNANKQVQQIVLSYIKGLNRQQLSKKQNLVLLRIFKDQQGAKEVANSYINSLQNSELFSLDNILLMGDFTNSSKDRGFEIFYHYGKRIDAIVNKQVVGENMYVLPKFSEILIDRIVYKEVILDYYRLADSTNTDIEWENVFDTIKKKISEDFAQRIVIRSKVAWYKYKTQKAEKENKDAKKWGEKFAKSFATKIEKYGVDTSGRGYMAAMTGNDLEKSIYRYCVDKQILNKAIGWLETVMISQPGTGYSYVYAGLLYKLGRVKDAIAWQKMTIQLYLGDCFQEKRNPESSWYTEQLEILKKMEHSEKSENIIFWGQ